MVRHTSDNDAGPFGLASTQMEPGGLPEPAPRHSRRLSDKILAAFHHACDVSDLEIAEQLLQLLETMTARRPRPEDGNRRRSMEGLVAAHERLWHLRHPQET